MSPCTSDTDIRRFAMALRGQSPDEYNAEDGHTRNTAEKQVETALQVTGFVMGTPLVSNNNRADIAGPWPSLFAVHPSVRTVIDREGDLWRRAAESWEFDTSWELFDKKIGAWRAYEISLRGTSYFAPFAAVEPVKEETKAERCPSEIEGWGCSLANGHDGDHTAHDQDGPAYTWPASSPVVPAPTEASVIGSAAVALRAALAVLDPHEAGAWEPAWRTVQDLEDCASRADQ
ncbi:hypothetical protein ACFVQ3_18735 [Oerskovia sp. NPDC057915]|uniref:hypothetical protein n=1 Tax=Oerskovia sp. NPDC057915 TaxID=3346280 RepID=UPI0036D7DA79